MYLNFKTIDYYLNYENIRYVDISSMIAVRMPATVCAIIKDLHVGNNLKRAVFCSDKQHDFPRCVTCLTVLSVLSELIVELCEMLIDGLLDDPYIPNTLHKCVNRISSIQDEKTVWNLLFSYLKS